MLSHRIPYPPHTGDKTRAYHVARHLAAKHDLTLAFLVDDPADLPGVAALRAELGARIEFAVVRKPWATLRGLAGLALGRPLTLGYFGSRDLKERVALRLAEAPHDLVYVHSSAMAQYAAGAAPTPVIMDFVDVDSDKWAQYGQKSLPPLSWLYTAEARALRRYEAEVARWARLCLVTTDVEQALLRSFAPWASTAVIPNGIDLSHFTPVRGTEGEPAIIFTGAMDYRPNIDAACHFHDEILPLIRREIPETRFYVVGLNPATSVRRLADTPGVVVTGTVPDVRPYYERALVAVAPLRMGRGVQNKVLQAMAMGVPVVATSGAARGLGAEPGQHLHVEDDPAAFAARTVGLLKRPAERQALACAARGFVEAEHSWESSLAQLETLLAEVTAARPVASLSAFPTPSPSSGRERAEVRVGEVSTP